MHHVETLVRHFRRAKEAEELSRDARQQANRRLSYHFDEDGSLVPKARLPAEVGALLLKALGTAMNELHADGVHLEPVAGFQDVPAGMPNVKLPAYARRVR